METWVFYILAFLEHFRNLWDPLKQITVESELTYIYSWFQLHIHWPEEIFRDKDRYLFRKTWFACFDGCFRLSQIKINRIFLLHSEEELYLALSTIFILVKSFISFSNHFYSFKYSESHCRSHVNFSWIFHTREYVTRAERVRYDVLFTFSVAYKMITVVLKRNPWRYNRNLQDMHVLISLDIL